VAPQKSAPRNNQRRNFKNLLKFLLFLALEGFFLEGW